MKCKPEKQNKAKCFIFDKIEEHNKRGSYKGDLWHGSQTEKIKDQGSQMRK